MAKLFGREYTKKELLSYSGNLSHIAGIKKMACTEGKASGMEIFEITTGDGLELGVTPGKCLDFSFLKYKGVNLSHQAKNGLIAPEYCLPVPGQFNRYVSTGMMFTCGLLSVGPESDEPDGTHHNAHGNIGVTPAENVAAKTYWSGDELMFEISGDIRESAQFGHSLLLHRTIRTSLGSKEIELCDVLENIAPEDTQFNILYHFNFGFPFLCEDLTLEFPENKISPRTPEAEAGLADAQHMIKPEDGFFEHVFFRDAKADENGICRVDAINKKLGIGAYIAYEHENLPVLAQWKSMRSGDYALGIEPTNCYIMGRDAERENGSIRTIKGFDKVEYRLRLGVYDI